MSQYRNIYQMQNTVSINRKGLIDRIITEDSLSKLDLRVFLVLLTKLEGWSLPEDVTLTTKAKKYEDPHNFSNIDTKQIASLLDVKRKKVEASIETLLTYGIIEEGDSNTVSHGYRFTF